MDARHAAKGSLPLHRQGEAAPSWSRRSYRLLGRPVRLVVLLAFVSCIYLFLQPRPGTLSSNAASANADAELHKDGTSTRRLPLGGGSSRDKYQHILPSNTRVVDGVDFSHFAYVQYATSTHYLCNAVMMFEALHRLNSSASRLLLYNDEWAPKPPPVPHRSWLARFLFKPMPLTPAMLQRDSYIHKLLVLAQEQYNVILKPVPVLRRSGEWTWAESFTKLLAFNQTQYKRVLSLDSDATLLAHMDDLFLRPSTAIAAPRAYWLEDQKVLSSQVMLIEPSQDKWDKIMARIEKREQEEFDMEVLNAVFGKEATVLEHRGYDLLSGEFRKTNHTAYLAGVSGEDKGEWNATRVLEQAKYVHFSDWPLKKPWFYRGEVREKFREHQPTCEIRAGGETLCSDRDAWLWLYNDFLERREKYCNTKLAHLEDDPSQSEGPG